MGRARRHRVAVLALPRVYLSELGIPARILGAAAGRYEVVVCSADGGPVETNAGRGVGRGDRLRSSPRSTRPG